MSGRKENTQSGVMLLCAGLSMLLLTACAYGLVLHPDGEPPVNWTAKPPDSVVGQWGSNASCVAIAPNYILTARHQGGGIGTSVVFSGVNYLVAQIWNEPSTAGSADLRICRIKQVPPPEDPNADIPANLHYYVTLYIRTDEAGQDVVIGSYGDGRGAELKQTNQTYGYQWDGSTNTTQRWGSNTVDATLANGAAAGFVTDLLRSDFDGLGEGNSTPYEAAGADHDSAGGWFVQCEGVWRLMGLNLYVEGHENFPEQTWFREMTNPNSSDPDINWALRISSYASWINSIVAPPTCVSLVAGDFSGDCSTDGTDLDLLIGQWRRTDCSAANNDCAGVDFQPDGSVNMLEFAFLTAGWLTSADSLQPCT